jgi:hypothetical protein
LLAAVALRLAANQIPLGLQPMQGIGNMNTLGRAVHRVLELSRMQGRREVGASAGLMVTVWAPEQSSEGLRRDARESASRRPQPAGVEP